MPPPPFFPFFSPPSPPSLSTPWPSLAFPPPPPLPLSLPRPALPPSTLSLTHEGALVRRKRVVIGVSSRGRDALVRGRLLSRFWCSFESTPGAVGVRQVWTPGKGRFRWLSRTGGGDIGGGKGGTLGDRSGEKRVRGGGRGSRKAQSGGGGDREAGRGEGREGG